MSLNHSLASHQTKSFIAQLALHDSRNSICILSKCINVLRLRMYKSFYWHFQRNLTGLSDSHSLLLRCSCVYIQIGCKSWAMENGYCTFDSECNLYWYRSHSISFYKWNGIWHIVNSLATLPLVLKKNQSIQEILYRIKGFTDYHVGIAAQTISISLSYKSPSEIDFHVSQLQTNRCLLPYLGGSFRLKQTNRLIVQ